MKQYDEIWVPNRNGEHEAVHLYTECPEQGRLRREKNVIVLTIEDLGDLWNAGYRAGCFDSGEETKLTAIDFEAYLQSKGLTIKQQ